MRATRIVGPPEVRYEAKIDRSAGADACHPWTASRTTGGYGQMTVDGRKVEVHRWAYLRFVGPLGPREQVRHSCDNRACQNQRHWLRGSHADNMRDMRDRKRQPHARLTHCLHGHPFDEANTYYRKDRPGSRQCRECNRLASLAYYPKRKRRVA